MKPAGHAAPAWHVCGMEVAAVNGSSCLAYIDPGSGTLALQLILATVLGGLFSLGGIVRKCWLGSAKRDVADRPAAADDSFCHD